jgi:superoxide reductase
MTTRLEIYKCSVCGNMVEVVHASGGTLVCCGQPMVRMGENTVDAAVEKHVPVVTRVDGGYKVSVGSVTHPMEEKHHIEWIEVVAGDQVHRRWLAPGQAPEATFMVAADAVVAREYCNLHGIWKR